MNSVVIRKEITIAAPASQVWRYVGTAAGLRQWWGVEISLEEKIGGRCEETGMRNGQPYRLVGEVTLYEPPHRLALMLHRRDNQDGAPLRTEVEITLAEEATHTTVAIIHRAFTAIAAVGATTAIGGMGDGPFMALPDYGSATTPASTPGTIPARFVTSALGTTWQQQQEAQWQRRCTRLSSLALLIIQQEAIFA